MILQQNFSIISSDANIKGDFLFQDELRVHGRIHGKVNGDKDSVLIIEENGLIDGEVNADTIVIHGAAQGKIHAKKNLIVHSTAKVLGEVQAAAIQVSPGSIFDAAITMAAVIEKPLHITNP
jgi:cytoskeletal protein CcmA (bactofilin family)